VRESEAVRVGVDTGGTFNDLVAADGRVVKVPSTPDDPAAAVRAAIRSISDGHTRPEVLAHGTTVATNALLERRGARVALVATQGFADEIEIARQARPSLYDPEVDRPGPLVERDLRFEVAGRIAADGIELEPLAISSLGHLEGMGAEIECVAVCLLHSDLEPAHEREVADRLRARGMDVTCSHEVSPEFREYERMVTTVVNAYLRPACRDYLRSLATAADSALVMTSAAGLVEVEVGAETPAALLLSGPAGGLRAAADIAMRCGFPDAVAFDMGGTSTDVGMILDGRPALAPQRSVAGFPIRMPALDIHTIGAGGGSIARIDTGGALVVGPRSAGARPGPVSYGRGGTEPTVTDADLVLGRIPDAYPFAGLGVLDRGAAAASFASTGIDPAGVIAVVDAAMEEAVRVVTVARGIDPRDLALVAFGGAGPLHACAIADALGMAAVVVPPRAGAFSAVGLLCAPRRREFVRSVVGAGEGTLDDACAEVAQRARAAMPGGEVSLRFDCRYEGQSHEITVDRVDRFAAEHERRNGFVLDRPAEVIAVRAAVEIAAPLTIDALPPVERTAFDGPAVIAEADCTTYVPAGWRASVGPLGAWILHPEPGA
jgi:N-methylhydantoinase A/oxoprolinase/acetone carboxylase beta subunit